VEGLTGIYREKALQNLEDARRALTAYAEHVTPPASPSDLHALQLIQLDASQWHYFDWQDWFAHFDADYQIPHDATTFNQVTLASDGAPGDRSLNAEKAWRVRI
jgi:hypothetical protein